MRPDLREPVYKNSAGHSLKFCHSAAARMCAYIQDRGTADEAGGVLLGRYILNSNNIVVDQISIPLATDHRTRTGFFRSACRHQRIIDAAWFASGGTCNYLGEWHTHSEPDPSPSFVDIGQWRKRLLFDRIDSDILHFAILGTKRLNVWQVDRATLSLEKLRRVHQPTT